MMRNTRTFFHCDKPGHFVADCPKKVENRDNYKHKSKMDGKYQSRHDVTTPSEIIQYYRLNHTIWSLSDN
jgi:hypothetical protein